MKMFKQLGLNKLADTHQVASHLWQYDTPN